MRLVEAIIDANHRALAGDTNAGLHPAEFAEELPLVALTCIDVRLNALLPQVLGVPQEQFIWLRNAGNIITGPRSSTMRSLSLACAVKAERKLPSSDTPIARSAKPLRCNCSNASKQSASSVICCPTISTNSS